MIDKEALDLLNLLQNTDDVLVKDLYNILGISQPVGEWLLSLENAGITIKTSGKVSILDANHIVLLSDSILSIYIRCHYITCSQLLHKDMK